MKFGAAASMSARAPTGGPARTVHPLSNGGPPMTKRCAYCGNPCRGETCQYHKDLPRIDPGFRPRWAKDDELANELRDALEDARRRDSNKSYVKGTGRKAKVNG